MLRILGVFMGLSLPLVSQAHLHYCDHRHNPDGTITWYCDRIQSEPRSASSR